MKFRKGEQTQMEKRALVISPIAPYFVTPAPMAEPDDEGWYGQIVELLADFRSQVKIIKIRFHVDRLLNQRLNTVQFRRIFTAFPIRCIGC